MATENDRQQYLIGLAQIITDEKLTSEGATQLVAGEIASWLMVIATELQRQHPDDKQST